MPLYRVTIEETAGTKIAGHTHLSGVVDSTQVLYCGLNFADYSDRYDVRGIIDDALASRTSEKVYIGYSRRERWNAITRKWEYSLHPVWVQRFSEMVTYAEADFGDDITNAFLEIGRRIDERAKIDSEAFDILQRWLSDKRGE